MSVFSAQLPPDWGQVFAFGTLLVLPVLIVFLLFQRYFIQSVAGSAIKGMTCARVLPLEESSQRRIRENVQDPLAGVLRVPPPHLGLTFGRTHCPFGRAYPKMWSPRCGISPRTLKSEDKLTKLIL